MNKLFWVCCYLFSMACQADSGQKSVLRELEGIWQGSAKQDDLSVWTIKVTITPERYLIDYPSLNCGGTLKLVQENTDSLVFLEVLTYGLDSCVSHGKTVLIKAAENTLRFYWYHENGGKKGAAGKLIRQVLPKLTDYSNSD
jgi:hypothetical protein